MSDKDPPVTPVRRSAGGLPRVHDDEENGSRPTQTRGIPLPIRRAPRQRLTVLDGVDIGRVFDIEADVLWMGRDPDCEVPLRDSGVSRRHASLSRLGTGLLLRDNGAKNGTFVNGRRIQEHELRRGDEIQLGVSVSLLYTYASGAEETLEQQRAAREQLLSDRTYLERIESIANMVTGVAHEINTPLGVAATANAMIADLAEDIERSLPGPQLDGLLIDLKKSVRLVSRNLERASRLVLSFKQLSSSQLCDEYTTCDLTDVIRDCLNTMRVETNKRNMTVRTLWAEDREFPWSGFPGHLSHVLVGLTQNVLRYAYPADAHGGEVDVRLSEDGDTYRVEFEDYGVGVPREIFPKLFEPFVTSGREFGSTGLGLAIVHNIVTNLLKGQISCQSASGKGTKFVILIPRFVPS